VRFFRGEQRKVLASLMRREDFSLEGVHATLANADGDITQGSL